MKRFHMKWNFNRIQKNRRRIFMRSIKLKHPANWITSIRLVSSFCLFFCNPFSFSFYFFYLLAGFSDIFDGYIARKTKTESEWGSKFDTFSDFIFIMVTLYKCIPYFHFDKWIVLFYRIHIFNSNRERYILTNIW